MTLQFTKFPSIEGFHNIVKLVESYPHLASTPFEYRGKIKLHGTSASVRVFNGEVIAQSMTRIITSEDDNKNFAQWVESTIGYWSQLKDEQELTIFGEWCGSGILKGTAVNKLKNKIFVIFAIMKGSVGVENGNNFPIEDANDWIVEPEEIKNILGDVPKNIYILPWTDQPTFVANFLDKETLNPIVELLNSEINKIEHCDPWIKENFGIEGICEGVVYYPQLNKLTRRIFSNFAFKAKGKKHQVVKVKEAVYIEPKILANINDFAIMFVTEARLEQGLVAIGGGLQMQNMGSFLKWMNSDIIKESTLELKASNLEWEQVQGAVMNLSRQWFMTKNKEI